MLRALVLVGLALSSASAFAYNQQAIDSARAIFCETSERFRLGEISRDEVAAAEASVVEMEHKARAIDTNEYCAAIVALRAAVLTGVRALADSGQRTTLELVRANEDYLGALNACGDQGPEYKSRTCQ